jgi:Flp pilus assembly pilin Flp
MIMKKRDLSPDVPLIDRRSLTPLEYALISGMLFGIVFLGFAEIADGLAAQFSNIGNSLSGAAG